MDHLARYTVELVNCLNHVNRDTDGTGLIRNRSSNGLANPPGCIRGEFISTAVFELVDRLHQANVAFLD